MLVHEARGVHHASAEEGDDKGAQERVGEDRTSAVSEHQVRVEKDPRNLLRQQTDADAQDLRVPPQDHREDARQVHQVMHQVLEGRRARVAPHVQEVAEFEARKADSEFEVSRAIGPPERPVRERREAQRLEEIRDRVRHDLGGVLVSDRRGSEEAQRSGLVARAHEQTDGDETRRDQRQHRAGVDGSRSDAP